MMYLRLPRDMKRILWENYGRFSVLCSISSAFSLAVAYTHLRMVKAGFLAHQYDNLGLALLNFPNLLRIKYDAYSQFATFQAAWTILYPVEFMFLSIAKLTALDFIVDIFKQTWGPVYGRQIELIRMFVYGSVQLFNVAGIAVMAASCYHWYQVEKDWVLAASLYADVDALQLSGSVVWNISDANVNANISVLNGLNNYYYADRLWLAQNVFEVLSLFVLTSAFVLTGRWSASRIDSAIKGALALRAETQIVEVGTSLKLKVVTTAIAIFFVFMFRFVYAIMTMVSNSSHQKPVVPGCYQACDSCQDTGWLVRFTLFYTPWIYATVHLFSSPFVLLVVLWGMVQLHAFTLACLLRIACMRFTSVTRIPQTSSRAWGILVSGL